MAAKRPVMRIAAGPSGSGKSDVFPGDDDLLDSFNVDDRCAHLNGGSYASIPPSIRAQAQRECEAFVSRHIQERLSFACETTLRSTVAIAQARNAKKAGFVTVMLFVATNDVEINIERIRIRGLAGKHSARPEIIREIYKASLANLSEAVATFDRVYVYDNSPTFQAPVLMLQFVAGKLQHQHKPLAPWVVNAFRKTQWAAEIHA